MYLLYSQRALSVTILAVVDVVGPANLASKPTPIEAVVAKTRAPIFVPWVFFDPQYGHYIMIRFLQ